MNTFQFQVINLETFLKYVFFEKILSVRISSYYESRHRILVDFYENVDLISSWFFY